MPHRRRMLISVLVPLLAAVVGALIYAFAVNPKLSEIGRLLLFTGLFWCVYALLRVEVRV